MSVFLHYSKKPISLAALVTKDQNDEIRSYGKPCGLWVSVQGDHDWLSWCTSESFGIQPLAHQVKLALGSNILWLTDALEIDVFTERYREEASYQGSYGINWKRVAADHDGVIIAPYCWERRLYHYTDWYYGWDCASGCIWNPRAIAEVRRVPELDPIAAKEEEISA